jgi:hypothetical protein
MKELQFFIKRLYLYEPDIVVLIRSLVCHRSKHYYLDGWDRLVICDNVVRIPSYAFHDNRILRRLCKKITLPPTLYNIGRHAFQQFEYVESIDIPDGVTTVQRGVFMDCWRLRHVRFHGAIKAIETHAFCSCCSLRSIDFQNNKRFGISITFPTSLKHIRNYAFVECGSLRSISCPIPYNYQNVFRECDLIWLYTGYFIIGISAVLLLVVV